MAVAAVHADLAAIDRHTRAFLAALVDPRRAAGAAAEHVQSGYTYLHAERRLIAYNLDEPGMERLHGPPLPFARAMVGARTVHEWAHLADDAGWVPRTVVARRRIARCAPRSPRSSTRRSPRAPADGAAR